MEIWAKTVLAVQRMAGSAFREGRFAPAGMSFTLTTYVYGNKVIILSSKRETFGLIIESADIANAHRNYFEALWQISTPDRPDFQLAKPEE